MFKSKRLKMILSAAIALLFGLSAISGAEASAAAELSSGFRQLNHAQLLSDMGTGWNLGNTLEAAIDGKPYETGWGNPVVTKEFIAKVKNAGFKTIRIPVSYLNRIGSEPEYIVEAEWLDRVREVADYAISQDMYVIINMHGDGYKTVEGSWLIVDAADQDTIKDKYKKVWQQIADKFRNYDEHLIFESMNEEFDGDWDDPKPADYANLNDYNQIFVDTVRKTGGNNSARWLLIPGWNTNIDYTAGDYGFRIPDDTYRSAEIPASEKRIAISVHYYSPWDFCGAESQITQWGAGAVDADRTVSWCQEDYMESQLNAMYNKFVKQGYPFIIGEYGSIDKTKADPENNTYRRIFAEELCSKTKKYGGVPVYWDNGYNGSSGFGLFDRNTGLATQQGIIDAIMAAKEETPDYDPGVEPVVVKPTPVPDGSFVVTYDGSDSGTVNMTIESRLKLNIDSWTLEFKFSGDQKITSIWGGKYTQNGSSVVITNADYNGRIAANGGSISLGFNASGSGEKPTAFKVNGSLAAGSAAGPEIKYGDVDQDGSISSLDFAAVKKHLLGIEILTGDKFTAADVDGDKSITALDLGYIKKLLLGMSAYEDFPAVGK
ncbi:endoglucanase [Ruminiclostridium sufflavum DSM 19573]|uniref:Endoglucanase n=1 Tax=Ruminiclostridium sufflavum DSM 19573 TaxID=1121337 RepID=A0A318XK76_9FIRM|nr:cellulase family glycosylhydrolase [Ruminiclostridium sufflavum]PYG87806.1 endoglucanase [Ruminiclostridium sufflavum DSM 19573]